jgi:hypothetical protein
MSNGSSTNNNSGPPLVPILLSLGFGLGVAGFVWKTGNDALEEAEEEIEDLRDEVRDAKTHAAVPANPRLNQANNVMGGIVDLASTLLPIFFGG